VAEANLTDPVTEVVVVAAEKVVLEMSREEAEAVAVVLASVGGSPTRSARRFTDAVEEALSLVGFNGAGLSERGDLKVDSKNQYITFLDQDAQS
jgi:hypothetical protein